MSEHSLSQSQKLSQEQTLAPSQLQSLELLMAPIMELQSRIDMELAQNPVLEQLDDDGGDEEDLGAAVESDKDGSAQEDSKDEGDEWLKAVEEAEGWRDDLPKPSRQKTTAEDDERRQFLFDSLTAEPSLQETLSGQLQTSGVAPGVAGLAELVIGSIDAQGYLRSHLADLAILAGTGLDEMESALAIVQSFDPPGVAARDLRECLLLQLRRRHRSNSLAAKIVDRHLENLSRNRLPLIARAIGVEMTAISMAVAEIRALSPYPCVGESATESDFVVPEIFIERTPDGYTVSLGDGRLQRLHISPRYLRMLEDPATPVETKAYIRDKVLGGRNLMRAIEQRRTTMLRIAEVVVDAQMDFLDMGVEHLKPMTMREVADKVGVHETTVSRAASSKYVQTPQGVFELKYFFSGGYRSKDGEMLSNKAIMSKIAEIVDAEDASSPIPDDEIAVELSKAGFTVARRTVAKYRDELRIPSTRLRRLYK